MRFICWKSQPHISGLLMTLADGLRAKEKDIIAAKEAGEDLEGHEIARQILHRLLSSTNRRMHKGFPEMLTYLLRKPMEFSSHRFVHVGMGAFFTTAMGVVGGSAQPLQHRRHRTNNAGLLSLPEKPVLHPGDYKFRPQPLEDFPLYFFLSACTLTRELGRNSMDWVSIGGLRQRFCQMEPIRSRAFPELPLRDASHRPIHRYSHYVHLATDSSWRVPILHAKLPRLPDETATSFEKR